MSNTTAQDLKDLSRAHSYANWSVFGLIIPFVGLILAGMALSFLKVIPSNKDTKLRIQQVKKTAYLGIVVSIIAILFWGGFYRYNQYQSEKENIRIQQAAEQQAQQQKLDEASKDNTENTRIINLQNCLNSADSNYPWANMRGDVKRDPANTERYYDLYYQIKNSEEVSCNSRYGG